MSGYRRAMVSPGRRRRLLPCSSPIVHSPDAVYFEPVEAEDYRIERITPEAYPHLVTLMRRCFGLRPSLGQVRWKFNTAAFGAGNIGYIAYAPDGTPAAYYGVFPVVVRFQGVDHLAAQSGDTMTDPAHQKKGLFIRLAKL